MAEKYIGILMVVLIELCIIIVVKKQANNLNSASYCGILLIMDTLLNDLYYYVFKLSRYVDLTILDPKVCYLWLEF